MIELLEKRLLKLKGKRIVEFGAGEATSIHQRIAQNNQLTLSDIVKVKNDSCCDNIYFRVLDACNIADTDVTYEIAYSNMLVQHVDLEKHLNEIGKIIESPGGKYWFAGTGECHNCELGCSLGAQLNIDREKVLALGAKVIDERKYKKYFSSEVDSQEYLNSIFHKTTEKHTTLFLTKHYILFEKEY